MILITRKKKLQPESDWKRFDKTSFQLSLQEKEHHTEQLPDLLFMSYQSVHYQVIHWGKVYYGWKTISPAALSDKTKKI